MKNQETAELLNWLTVLKDKDLLIEAGEIITSIAAFQQIPDTVRRAALQRHWRGDWGDIRREDELANEQALQNGKCLFSAYNYRGQELRVITVQERGPIHPITWIGLTDDYFHLYLV